MARNTLIGIGAFALVMMGIVSTDPSDRDIALSNLSIGGTPALAQRRGGPPDIPDVLDTLDELDLLEPDDDDGPDDDGDDADGDAAADAAPRQRPRQSRGEKSVCEERAQHEDPGRYFAGSPCWAREAFGAGSRRR